MQYAIKQQQNVYDLAIMFGYGIERIIEFINDVGIPSIDSDIRNVTINVTKINTNLSDALTLQSITLATSVGSGGYNLLTDDGDPITDNDNVYLLVN